MLEVRLIARMASNSLETWSSSRCQFVTSLSWTSPMGRGGCAGCPHSSDAQRVRRYTNRFWSARETAIKSGETLDGPGHAEPSKTGRSVSPGDRLPATWD